MASPDPSACAPDEQHEIGLLLFSLAALILDLGLLVVEAIIAIEMMVVKMEEGMDRIQAAAFAWSHTAAPMLSGTLVTVVGFMPVGFAQSSAGEYAGNIFWIVGFALIASWVVAVAFTPYLGVKLLPAIRPVEGGHAAIYGTVNYRRLRRVIAWSVRRKFLVAGAVVAVFLLAGVFAQLLAPYGINETDLRNRLEGPSLEGRVQAGCRGRIAVPELRLFAAATVQTFNHHQHRTACQCILSRL